MMTVVCDKYGILHAARMLPSYKLNAHPDDIVFVAACQLLLFSITEEWSENDAKSDETNCMSCLVLEVKGV